MSHTPIYLPSTDDFSKHQAGITLRQCNDDLLVFIEKVTTIKVEFYNSWGSRRGHWLRPRMLLLVFQAFCKRPPVDLAVQCLSHVSFRKKKISKELLVKDALDKEIQRLREMLASTRQTKESRNEHLAALKDIVCGNQKEVQEKEAALEEQEEVMRKLKHQEASLLVDVHVSHVKTRNTIEV